MADNQGKRMLRKGILQYKEGIRRYLAAEIMIMAVYLLIDIVNPYLYKLLVDKVLIEHEISRLWPICLMMLAAFSLRYSFRLIQKREEIRYEYRMKKEVRNRVLSGFLTKGNENGSSRCLNIYDRYVDVLCGAFKKYGIEYFFHGLTIVVMIGITVAISWKLFLFSVLAILISFAMNKLYEKKVEKNTREETAVNVQNEGWYISVLQNSAGLKGINALKGITERSRERDREAFRFYKKEHNHLCALEILQDFNFRFVMEMSLYFFGGYLILQNQLLLGTFMSFVSYLKKMYNNIRQIEKKNVEFSRDRIFLEEVLAALRTEEDARYVREACGARKARRGEIVLENVMYRYGADGFCLNVEDLHIGSGEKVAIVGKSGCGKTTLTRILTKEIEGYKGSIFLTDGKERISAADIDYRAVRVEKEPYFFNLSVADNLRLMKQNLTSEELEEILGLIFSADEIGRMGFLTDRLLGENGCHLSGGQKERLNIARVMLLEPDLIVWDEAASQLNRELETETYQKMSRIFKDATQIFIAHKKEVMPFTDKTIYIENGCVKKVMESKRFVQLKDYKALFGVD